MITATAVPSGRFPPSIAPGNDVRIALTIPGGLDPSGRERMIPALLWLTERLVRRHDIEVFSLRQFERPRSYQVRGVIVHDLGLAASSRLARPGLGLHRFMSRLRARPPFDVFHGCWLGLTATLATLGAAVQHKPVIISLMGTELVEYPGLPFLSRARRLASRLALRRASHITVGSGFLARYAAARRVATEFVPLGVDPAWFESPARAPGPPWRVLHVASLNAWKDQPTLLRAVAEIVRQEPRLHLDIVGEDTLGGRIAGEVSRLGLHPFVTFHGFVPSEELRSFYRQSHLLVLASRYEAQAVVVLEAAMLSLPTVGTAVGLIADGDGDWTMAVPIGDPAALAQAVLTVLRDTSRRLALGARAACWARQHDADWTATRFEALYTSALKGTANRT